MFIQETLLCVKLNPHWIEELRLQASGTISFDCEGARIEPGMTLLEDPQPEMTQSRRT